MTMRYTVVLKRESDDGYVATAPSSYTSETVALREIPFRKMQGASASS